MHRFILPCFLKKSRIWVLATLALLAGGLGCTEDRSSPGDHASSFTDDLGRSLTLDLPVDRVLTLSPNLTEIVYAAGAGGKLVGANAADDYPPAVDTLPRFSVLPVDFEAITALQPDLLLATDQTNNPRDAETFAELGIPTAFFSFNSLGDIFRVIREVGTLTGTEAHADATADSLEAVLHEIKQQTAGVTNRPLVLFLIGDETLYSFGSSSYVQDVIRIAGGRSATANLDKRAPILNEEFVLTKKPDVIVGAFGSSYDTDQLIQLHPTWKAVPAVRNGRVYSLDQDIILRPGPRVVKATRRIAAFLHPGRVTAPPPDEPVSLQ